MNVQEAIDSLALVEDKTKPLVLGLTDLEHLDLEFVGWTPDGNDIKLVLTGLGEEQLTGVSRRSTMDARLDYLLVRPYCARCKASDRKLELPDSPEGPALCGICITKKETEGYE